MLKDHEDNSSPTTNFRGKENGTQEKLYVTCPMPQK